ncbi:MAG: type VI secretion system tip protein VgrG [Candidatus Zixiibacteriota bacterium]|nr:MAG: type VI secretion system tip protein VgrG [candidate division Zixibacteria bacterium]
MAKIETPCICTIKIDNKEIKHTVSSVQLKQYIDDHHELQIRVKQVGKASSEQDFDDPGTYTAFLGKSAAVTMAPAGGIVDPGRELEFIGLVTDVKLENSIDGLNTVLIVAKSPTVTMDGSPQMTVYQDQSASDIIGAIVANFPLTRGKIESGGSTMKYSVQYRETDWTYIKRLAEGAGLYAYYDGKEFSLQKSNGSSFEELVWRETLGSFSMGLGTAPSKYESKSWEYGKKAVLESQIDSSTLRSAPSDITRVSIDASQKIFERPGYVPTVKATDQSSVDTSLGKRVESQVGQMVSCVGESIVPAVKVGHCIKIAGMSKLDGLYWVKAVTHSFDESGKYSNEFVCSPLDISFPARKTSRPSITNLQSGLVTDLDDPDGLGRIKVKIPALGIETLWVRYVWPHAGSEHGWVTMPEVDDEVLIGWENGNPDLPVALGSLYSGTDTLPVTPDTKNEVKVFLTKGGNEIKLTDKDGEEEIKISTKDGKNVIVLSGKDPSVSITTDGDIKFESTGDFSIKGKNVKIESDAAIDVKSGADLNLEGGANLKATASANLNVEASAQCVVKGAIINLN